MNSFDAVAIEHETAMEDAIRAAWQNLVDGGTLMINCNIQHLTMGTEHNAWFRQRDFHVVQTKQLAAGRTIIVAHKRTRRLRDIARDVCSTLNVPGVTAESVSALLNPDW